MLQEIRKHSGNIVIKIILSVIGVSFVAVGIIDVFRLMTDVPPVAKIGRFKISFQDFYQEYWKALTRARQKNPNLSKDEAENILPKELLETMITQKVLQLEPNKRGIVVPDRMIIDTIRSLPFCQVNGKFDLNSFQRFLAATGMSAGKLMDNLKQEMRIQQLIVPASQGARLNQGYIDLLVDTLSRKKNFNVVLIPWDRVPESKPTESDLEEWVSKHQEKYELPDQRTVEVLWLDHKVLGKQLPLTEEKIRQEYETRKEEWTTPAQREMYRMEFESEADAKDAKKIFAGKPLTKEAVAKALPHVELVPLQVREIPAENADVVLGLSGGEALLAHEEKWTLYVMLKHEPEVAKPFEKVRSEVEQALRAKRVQASINGIKDKIEDALAAGKTVEEIAKDTPLKAVTLTGLTPENIEEQVHKAFGEQSNEALTKLITMQAFALEKGEESPFEDAAGASLIVKIVDIRARHLPEMAEIHDKAQADWIEHRRQQSARELAFTLFGKVTSPDDWAKALKKSKLKAQAITVSRLDCEAGTSDLNKTFGGSAIQELLLSASNTVDFVLTKDQQIAAVFVGAAQSDAVAALDSSHTQQKERIRETLNASLPEEFSHLLMESIQATYKIKINQKSIDKVVKTRTGEEA